MIDDMNGEIYVEPPFEAVIVAPEPTPEQETMEPVLLLPEPADSDSASQESEEDIPSSGGDVVSVEELLDRLAQAGRDTEETSEEPDTGAEAAAPSYSDVVDSVPIEGVGQLLQHLETLEHTVVHPMLTTSFQDYTVTEGLLLALLLSVFLSACVKMLKGGFAWLR